MTICKIVDIVIVWVFNENEERGRPVNMYENFTSVIHICDWETYACSVGFVPWEFSSYPTVWPDIPTQFQNNNSIIESSSSNETYNVCVCVCVCVCVYMCVYTCVCVCVCVCVFIFMF